MHRSTRVRRLAVAFIVVLMLAVAARFARATPTIELTPAPERTSVAGAPLAAASNVDDLVILTFLLPYGWS